MSQEINRPPGRLTRISFGFLVFAVTILFIINVLLLKQNESLRKAAIRSAAPLVPLPGTRVPSIHGIELSGRMLTFDYGPDPRKTLLFVFSLGCPICTENWPAWDEILSKINHETYRIVFVDLSSQVTPDYIQLHKLGTLHVISDPDPKFLVSYNLRFTPQLVLISNDGKIEKVWPGLLDKGDLASIGQSLGRDFRTDSWSLRTSSQCRDSMPGCSSVPGSNNRRK